MKIISWNYRGLLGASTVRSLLDIQRRHEPDAFFLFETHLNTAWANKLLRKLKMDRVEVVESVGASGGLLLLLLFWRSPVVIHINDKTKNFIDAMVGGPMEEKWRFTEY